MRFVKMTSCGVIMLFIFERFEELRKSQGKTKTHIASLIGRTPTVVQDWKQGKSEPNAEQLAVICNELNTTPDYLTGKTNKKTATSEGDGLTETQLALIDIVKQMTEEEASAYLASASLLKDRRKGRGSEQSNQ